MEPRRTFRAFSTLACLLAAFSIAVSPLGAVPWEWAKGAGGNGHFYDFRRAPGTDWSNALVNATLQPALNGAPGHLASITSQDENDLIVFIRGLVFGPSSVQPTEAWIGGLQQPSLPPPDANWQWVTGEPFSFQNWTSGEPNDFGGAEDRLEMTFVAGRVGEWNDDVDASAVSQGWYVVEWDVVPQMFIRGDANLSGNVNLTDGIAVLNSLFSGAGPVACPDAADTNDDGQINLTDPIGLFNYLFLGGPPPSAPHPLPDYDPTGDPLGC